MKQRRRVGITWDELPSIGANSNTQVIFAYPRGEPFDKISLRAWLNEISSKKAQESERVTADFAKSQGDPTLYEFYLDKTIKADRKTFEEVVLREDTDSVVLFYSTENVNYLQR